MVNEHISFLGQVKSFIQESGEPKRDVVYNMYRVLAKHQEILKDHDGAITSYVEIAKTLESDIKQSWDELLYLFKRCDELSQHAKIEIVWQARTTYLTIFKNDNKDEVGDITSQLIDYFEDELKLTPRQASPT